MGSDLRGRENGEPDTTWRGRLDLSGDLVIMPAFNRQVEAQRAQAHHCASS